MPSSLRRALPCLFLLVAACGVAPPAGEGGWPVPPLAVAGADGAVAADAPDCAWIVLGTAQDGGLPQLGCDGECCRQARARGTSLLPACLGVVDRRRGGLLLLEATPAIEAQVARLQAFAGTPPRGRQPVDGVLLTHAHIGHYLGLAAFGREAAASRALPVWCSPRLAAFLHDNGPWSQLVALRQIELRTVAPAVPFAPLPDLQVEAVPVPHRGEFSDTMAFKLHGPRRTVLFVPDVDAWERAPGLLDQLLEGVDVAYLDGTFWDASDLPDRDPREIPHPPMTTTMALLAARARARPGSIRFLHCNHGNPVLRQPALQARLTAAGFALARPGENGAL